MSSDLQIISLVDDLQVTSTRLVPGSSPRQLLVRGLGGFAGAQTVQVNDLGVQTFLVLSDRELLVTLPEALGDAVPPFRVIVLSSSLSNADRVRVVFGPTRTLRTVEGTQKLVQQILKTLISRLGSNKFRPQYGGSLLELLQSSFSAAERVALHAALAQSLDDVEGQVIASQAGVRGLRGDERLLALSLLDVSFDTTASEVRARIKVQTYSGGGMTLPLVL